MSPLLTIKTQILKCCVLHQHLAQFNHSLVFDLTPCSGGSDIKHKSNACWYTYPVSSVSSVKCLSPILYSSSLHLPHQRMSLCFSIVNPHPSSFTSYFSNCYNRVSWVTCFQETSLQVLWLLHHRLCFLSFSLLFIICIPLWNYRFTHQICQVQWVWNWTLVFHTMIQSL